MAKPVIAKVGAAKDNGSATSEPSAAVERLTLPLKDGKIDWSTVRPARVNSLKELLSKSGIDAAAPVAVSPKRDPIVNAALAGTLYDLLAQVEALVAVRLFGCPVDQAFEALKFTDAEKAALADPTARVIDKYLPAALLEKYADEMMLLLLLGTMTRTKVAALQASIKRRKADSQVGHTRPLEVKRETDKSS